MRLVICSVLLLSGAAVATARQQESADTVKDLYAAAAYEDALAAASRRSDRLQPQIEQYRVFSLVALGRLAEAEEAMEALISADPLFVLDPADTPPRVHDAFQDVREKVLPEIAGRLYLDARAALDRKDRAGAIEGFERLVTVIDTASPGAASLGELRILANGFLDLSRALEEAAASSSPPPAAVPAALPEPEPAPVMASATTDTRPVAVRQELPPWGPSESVMRKGVFTGAIRIGVSADGRVDAAEIVRSVHPMYDQALLEAARGWLYQPATRNDKPVAAEITVEVTLRPPQ